MILIQISVTIIIVLYWLVVPAALVYVWVECRLEKPPIPFRKVLKDVNWVGIFWWFLIGLLFTGGLIELWRI